MLSGIYSREASNPGLTTATSDIAGAHAVDPLPRSLGRIAELVLASVAVLLASGAVWSVSSWLLASWELK